MSSIKPLIYSFALLLIFGFSPYSSASAKAVAFPAHVDHSIWDALLKKYVNSRGLVDYAGWKANKADRKALDAYLASYAKISGKKARGKDLGASTANAYNAFAIDFILDNYPVKRIVDHSNAFTEKRNLIGGRKVSLDEIEKETGIPVLGWKAHGIFVCCAKSCPPLQRFAYTPAKLDSQIDTAFRAFVQRDDLNHIQPKKGRVNISKLFDWYQSDFAKGGGPYKVLATYATPMDKAFLLKQKGTPSYLKYNWLLNQQ